MPLVRFALSLPAAAMGGDWHTIRTLLPYLWAYKGRVLAALTALIAAKIANVGVPVLMKEIVDRLDATMAILAVPLLLLVAYGALRLSTTFFTELREYLFAKVTQRAVRTIAPKCSVTCTRFRSASILRGRPAGSPGTSSAVSAASRP
jgi:ATP-binding cassette subfamily B protein